ncbi:MAG: hypothetical protein Hals2KO_39580 [Halioglobus sp.]
MPALYTSLFPWEFSWKGLHRFWMAGTTSLFGDALKGELRIGENAACVIRSRFLLLVVLSVTVVL